jgi:hypothetical protein
VMDGQTGWEHGLSPLPIYSDVSRFIGATGAFYSPTVIVSGHGRGAVEYFRPRHDFGHDAKYRRYAPLDELQEQVARSPLRDLPEYSYPIVAEGLADIIRAGGHGGLGEHAEQTGIGTHWELWAYGSALTPMEALRVGTIDGAYTIGLEREVGSVSVGKLADLLVLDANPLDKLTNSLSLRFVMKGGRLYQAETLDEVWPGKRRFLPVAEPGSPLTP